MSVVISKDKNVTIIAAVDKRYAITQYPNKGIELSIGTIKSERLSNELEIRLAIPIGTKTQEGDAVEDTPEIVIWPIPLKVLYKKELMAISRLKIYPNMTRNQNLAKNFLLE